MIWQTICKGVLKYRLVTPSNRVYIFFHNRNTKRTVLPKAAVIQSHNQTYTDPLRKVSCNEIMQQLTKECWT